MTQQSFRRLTSLVFVLGALVLFNLAAMAQTNLSDTRPGSVLFFNRYTSNPNTAQQADTQINITNTNANDSAAVHLFFVDGATCSIADFILSLTPSQTVSFLMSDLDPGVDGYIIAVATEGGVPTQFNWLVGSAYIRENDGRQATLPATTITKLSPGPIDQGLDGNYRLTFNGTDYDRLPNAVAVTSFNSETTDSNNLIIYSPTTNLTFGSADPINTFVLLFDDQENSISSSFTLRCYKVDSFTSLFNRSGGINRHVPAGRTGWVKISSTGRPLLGSVISRGPGFSGGYNLPAVGTLPNFEIIIPVY
ncbi:MAG TPA: hypothetical protein VJ302_01285 [Blastocatellia bacterium]|nr:hypothetical protein [Blastocatellia bacterium]